MVVMRKSIESNEMRTSLSHSYANKLFSILHEHAVQEKPHEIKIHSCKIINEWKVFFFAITNYIYIFLDTDFLSILIGLKPLLMYMKLVAFLATMMKKQKTFPLTKFPVTFNVSKLP